MATSELKEATHEGFEDCFYHFGSPNSALVLNGAKDAVSQSVHVATGCLQSDTDVRLVYRLKANLKVGETRTLMSALNVAKTLDVLCVVCPQSAVCLTEIGHHLKRT